MKLVKQVLDKKGYDVWFVHPDDTVFDAITMLAEKEIGTLIVIEDEKLVGVLSERDYARNVILRGKSSLKTPVREIMSTRVVCTWLDQTIQQCMAVMSEKHIRHLPVLEKKQLIGMISIGDVVKAIIEDQKFEIEELYHYIQSA